MKILADVREPDSGVPRALRAIGVDVAVIPLEGGDYEVAAGIVIERKRVLDLHESVRQGRFWSQLGKLRRAASNPYLLVEGRNLYDGPLGDESVRGLLLAVLEQRVRVIFSASREDSALWLRRLAIRARTNGRFRDMPSYAQRPKHLESASEAVLAAVPGISVVTARALLDRFGSIRELLAADPSDWETVQGLGAARSSALRDALL